MTHGSLFSGIGGFDLAAEWMGWQNIFHCEWMPFPRQILHHYWPNAISYEDITKTNFTIHKGSIDILTGGFPCQPYSSAGKRLGKNDQRHLWPEMLRAIHEIKPTYIVGENVYGLTNWGGEWYSTKCALTWKIVGTKYNRYYCRLVPLVRRTEGTESGLLLTPGTVEIAQTEEQYKQRQKKRTEEGRNIAPHPGNKYNCLLSQILYSGMFPTPRASDKNMHWKTENWRGDDLGSYINEIYGTRSHLNPLFVAEMMGFPPNWTILPFQNGAMNQ